MRLLLMGHGYLGQAVAREFRAAGWQVTAASRSGSGGEQACDVSSLPAVMAWAGEMGRPDVILHCAASGRGGEEAYRQVYVEGCCNLIAAFPGVPLWFTSSTSVYAQTDGSEVTEDSPARPDRATGQLLLEAEGRVLAAGGGVARLSGIYGPGRSVILKRFLQGEARLEEEGQRFLNQIHRDDAARALRLLAESRAAEPAIFNVSDDRPVSQRECYAWLAGRFGLPLPPSGPRDPNRKRGWTHKRVSNAKLRARGWKPRYPCFLDAVDDLVPTLQL